MELDFSKIDKLGSSQRGLEKAVTEPLKHTPSTPKKPAERKPEAHNLQRKADQRKQQLETSADILKEYQANKRLTTTLISEINHGLQQGLDIHDLFLKAVEGLALTTNDPALLTRSKEAIQSIYGIGLKQPRALELEKQATQERLERLTESLSRAESISDQLRLRKAVEAHQKRLKSLEDS